MSFCSTINQLIVFDDSTLLRDLPGNQLTLVDERAARRVVGTTVKWGMSLEVEPHPEYPEGFGIARVAPGKPAANAGIRAGDVLLSIDGNPIGDEEGHPLMSNFTQYCLFDEVSIVICRDGQLMQIEALLETSDSPYRCFEVNTFRRIFGVQVGPLAAQREKEELEQGLRFVHPMGMQQQQQPPPPQPEQHPAENPEHRRVSSVSVVTSSSQPTSPIRPGAISPLSRERGPRPPQTPSSRQRAIASNRSSRRASEVLDKDGFLPPRSRRESLLHTRDGSSMSNMDLMNLRKRSELDDPAAASSASARGPLPDPWDAAAYTKLHHCGPAITEQFELGGRVMKRTKAFLDRVVQIQRDAAKELAKAAKEEREKLLKYKGLFDAQDSTKAWLDAMRHFSDQATDRTDTVSKCLESFANDLQAQADRVGAGHQRFLKESAKLRPELLSLHAPVQPLRSEVAKAKGKATKVLSSLKSRMKAQKKEWRKSKKFKENPGELEKFKKDKKTERSRADAEAAGVVYQKEIDRCNAVWREHYSRRVPNFMLAVQASEQRRTETLARAMVGTGQAFLKLSQDMARHGSRWEEVGLHQSTTAACAKDAAQFARKVLKEQGDAPAGTDFSTKASTAADGGGGGAEVMLPFHYDLDYTVSDLEHDWFYSDYHLFQSTLEAVMAYEQTQMPAGLTLTIPRIMTSLVEAVVDKGGLDKEGIFRISVTEAQLSFLRRRLEQGRYDMSPIQDPHLPAAVLKDWLRSLAVPVVPYNLYMACINIGKTTAAYLTHSAEKLEADDMLAQLALKDAEQVAHMLRDSFAARLPRLSRDVLCTLCVLLRQIASPEHVKRNKMNIKNLAVVFAPSLLNVKPDDPRASDHIALMEDSKYTVDFVTHLLYNFEHVFDKETVAAAEARLNFAASKAPQLPTPRSTTRRTPLSRVSRASGGGGGGSGGGGAEAWDWRAAAAESEVEESGAAAELGRGGGERSEEISSANNEQVPLGQGSSRRASGGSDDDDTLHIRPGFDRLESTGSRRLSVYSETPPLPPGEAEQHDGGDNGYGEEGVAGDEYHDSAPTAEQEGSAQFRPPLPAGPPPGQ